MCFDKKTNNKILNCVSFLTIIAALIMIGTVVYWYTAPYKPLILNTMPLPVYNKTVKTGGVLVYKLDYCKSNNFPVKINRKFMDGIIYSVPEIQAQNEPGCRIMNIGVEIPHNLPIGKYILNINYTYQVNPLRIVTVETHTEEFEVIE